MAVVPRKLGNGKVVYWVTFQHCGKPVWERIGFDKRAAERRDDQQKAERKSGKYRPGKPSSVIRVGPWFERYLPMRTNRAAEGEAQKTNDHVLSRDWFSMMRVVDVQGPDIERLVKEMKAEKKIGNKVIANTFTIVRQGFQRAIFEGLRADNPCDALDRGTVPRGGGKQRQPYSRGEARAVMALPATPDWLRVFCTELFYTGQREGEVLGRRWRDLELRATPLPILKVHTQYEDQPLKTDDLDKVRPRFIPVHPELQAVLEYWWNEGFELQHLRKPTPDDFIIPAVGGGCLGRSAAYKAFRRALRRAEVGNRSLHSTRHTFISVARAGSDRHDLVERITHNAKGSTLDSYTHSEWESLCAVILGLDYSLDRITTAAFFTAPTQGLEPWSGHSKPRELSTKPDLCWTGDAHQITRENRHQGDTLDASQDPEAFAFGVALAEHQGALPPAEARRSAPSIIIAAPPPAAPGLRTFIEFKGERKTVTEWAAEVGIPKKTLAARLVNGWSAERALTEPFNQLKSRASARSRSPAQPPKKTSPYFARRRSSAAGGDR
jgi:integrase